MAVWRVVARWVGQTAGACVLAAVAGCEGVWWATWGVVVWRGVACGVVRVCLTEAKRVYLSRRVAQRGLRSRGVGDAWGGACGPVLCPSPCLCG